MKTMRDDVIRNKQQIYCPNASWIGFSSSRLKFGDLFNYKTEDGNIHLAKCHGKIRAKDNSKVYILAQVADVSMQYSMERWIDPRQVINVTPKERVRKCISDFFVETENYFN